MKRPSLPSDLKPKETSAMVEVGGKLQRGGWPFAMVNLPLKDGHRQRRATDLRLVTRRWSAYLAPSMLQLIVAMVSVVTLTSQYYMYSTNKSPPSIHAIPSSSDAEKCSKHQLLKCNNDDSVNISNRLSDQAFNLHSSKVDSLFNCDLPTALCTYYYPANFFDENCGLGKGYAHFIKDAEEKKQNGSLWNYMPSMGFPTLTLDSTCVDVKKQSLGASSTIPAKSNTVLKDIGQHNFKDGQHCLTERISLLPVHKAGCSSLRKAYDFISSKESNALRIRHKLFAPKKGPKDKGNRKADEAFALDALAKATKYPDKEFAPEQHVLFAVVRDPTERFISSIGQALGATGSRSNRIGPILKKECIKETSRETLKCLAHYVKDHGFWIELHFTPQVVDISFTTIYQDVPVGVFPFKELSTILEYLGRGDVWERHGSDESYRSEPILRNMTVADYDEESLQIVCEIYEMDVRMQRSIGIQVPRCDPFIPHYYDFEQSSFVTLDA